MRSRLILELGNRTDIPVPLWNEWINDAYLDLVNSLELPESYRSFELTTVAGQAFYLLPSTVYTVRDISATDPSLTATGGALEKLDIYSYRKLPIRSSSPDAWLREQGVLVLWPTPDKEYTLAVDARLQPMKLAADDDYPLLEDKWHETLLKAAKFRAWEAVQNDTKSALVENAVARMVQRQNDRDEREKDTEYPAMRPIFSRRELMALRRNPRVVEPGDG
jgi:hypothetical protein